MQKGFAQTLILVFILLILGSIAGYWLFFSKQPQAVIQKQTKSLVSSTNENIKPEVYKDGQLGLEVEVPEGFSLEKESETEYFKRANGDTRKNFTYYVQYPPAEFAGSFYVIKKGETDLGKAALSLVAFKNPDSLDPKSFYNRYWYYPFIWGEFSSIEKPKIAPEKIELIEGREAGSAVVDFREDKPKFIYLPYGDKGLMLQIHLPSGNPESENILKTLVLN